jgi:hypothetical protein
MQTWAIVGVVISAFALAVLLAWLVRVLVGFIALALVLR